MKHFTYCKDGDRAALLFDAELSNQDIIRSALRLSFLPELFGKPFYAFSAHDGRIIISSWLESVPHFPEALSNKSELVIVNKTIHRIPLRKMYARCYDLAKLGSDCESCPKKGRACMESLLMKSAWEHGLSLTLGPTQPFISQIDPADSDDLQKLDRFLRHQSPNDTWAYVPPHLTSDLDLITPKRHHYADHRQTLRDSSEHDFTCIKEVGQRYSDRSRSAAETRKAIKRCKNECILYPSCDWSTKPYHGAPRHCQKKDYGSQGPYTLEKIHDKIPLPDIPRDVVSLIAYNGGLETRIFGYWVQLQKMDFVGKTVEFIPVSGKSTAPGQTLTIEDALKLCKIPYRENGEYEKPRFHELTRLMDDDELRLYLLCCQYNETKGYRRTFGWTEPRIASIEWLSPTSSIKIATSHGWSVRHISEYHDLLSVFGRDVVRYF